MGSKQACPLRIGKAWLGRALGGCGLLPRYAGPQYLEMRCDSALAGLAAMAGGERELHCEQRSVPQRPVSPINRQA